MGAASSSQRTFEDAEEWEDQSFHHEYAQPGPATWDEEEEEDESSVSIHVRQFLNSVNFVYYQIVFFEFFFSLRSVPYSGLFRKRLKII